ncbi:hypothetical protein M569_03517, partial [Genlisea aurea]
VMNDENRSSDLHQPEMRMTRARSKSLGISNGLPPLCPSKKGHLRKELKREAENSATHNSYKKRGVLKDVTNINREKLCMNSKNAAGKKVKIRRKATLQKKEKPTGVRLSEASEVTEHGSEDELEESEKTEHNSKEVCSSAISSTSESESINFKISSTTAKISEKKNSKNANHLWMKPQSLEDRGIIDIDSKSNNDQQMCSVYAAHIYDHLYAKEVDHRPLVDYMEKLQRDITKGMRGILIDWLVEVCEEYRLVPDTLYLTVNLIDRYLSGNFMKKQKLQLLGVTCMLIASKYEEICAPRVEEFCFITDSTYTKEEVVKMESQVLNFVKFQLSVPTTKKFLRRFVQAAQASYEVPSVELEFLANYLAELSLTDYTFLKFLPSLVAASAVFLARWTLDQTQHPWNPTLEHYTRCRASDLQTAVVELQTLQLDTGRCAAALNAVHEKYKQPKFKAVSMLRPSRPIESLF